MYESVSKSLSKNLKATAWGEGRGEQGVWFMII